MPSLCACPNCSKTAYRDDRLHFPTVIREDGSYEPADYLDVIRRNWRCRKCTNRIRAVASWSRDNGLVFPVGGAA